MKGLTLTQAANIEEVLKELESETTAARRIMGTVSINVNLRIENVEQFCATLREVLG